MLGPQTMFNLLYVCYIFCGPRFITFFHVWRYFQLQKKKVQKLSNLVFTKLCPGNGWVRAVALMPPCTLLTGGDKHWVGSMLLVFGACRCVALFPKFNEVTRMHKFCDCICCESSNGNYYMDAGTEFLPHSATSAHPMGVGCWTSPLPKKLQILEGTPWKCWGEFAKLGIGLLLQWRHRSAQPPLEQVHWVVGQPGELQQFVAVFWRKY